MAEQKVTLQPGESKVVSFEATPKEAKTYQVSINGLTGSFSAFLPTIPKIISAAFPPVKFEGAFWPELGLYLPNELKVEDVPRPQQVLPELMGTIQPVYYYISVYIPKEGIPLHPDEWEGGVHFDCVFMNWNFYSVELEELFSIRPLDIGYMFMDLEAHPLNRADNIYQVRGTWKIDKGRLLIIGNEPSKLIYSIYLPAVGGPMGELHPVVDRWLRPGVYPVKAYLQAYVFTVDATFQWNPAGEPGWWLYGVLRGWSLLTQAERHQAIVDEARKGWPEYAQYFTGVAEIKDLKLYPGSRYWIKHMTFDVPGNVTVIE